MAGRNINSTIQAIGSHVSANSRSSNSPLPKLFVGVLLLSFFVIGFLLHIQTSEAFFLGGRQVSLSPNWGVLLQPYLLFAGQLEPAMARAVMWGWSIELIFLTCVIGYEVAHDAVASSSRRMAGWFRTGTIILIFFNGYTDFLFGSVSPGSGFWGQLAFALVTSFCVFFFGTIGWRFCESALTDWNR